ncbi:nidogen-like domain-containing protein [Salinibacterium soli]|uniref:LPXTG cell wall anchor domain-containing protein n=1 Tax=Antiquaquibacter soli TaxID=3064523 RepID=A0ABT9BNN0_9MICO|nr:nidogen-like domain-containing protein [Protaetiibacter sp. WY-16]MDO7882646.1 LPXTG cell wall anchor domain-containing protein [Protaetiibacter sp. WY-16]
MRNVAKTTLAALSVAAVITLGIPSAAFAAGPGVGDVSDAMIYGTDGPVGSIVAELSDEDDDTETVALPFPINFFGTAYAALCISTNGVVYPVPTTADSCEDEYDENLADLAEDSEAPVIAALAADIDLENKVEDADGNPITDDGFGVPAEIYFGTTTVDGKDAVVITWYRVQMFDDDNDKTLSNTFQIVFIKEATTDGDTVGYDFTIQFNFGTATDPEDGYVVDSEECTDEESEETPVDCYRWGVGWANWDGTTATPFELFPTTPRGALVDGAATSLTANSLNSSVLGRYTWGMVGGVTVGFAVPQMGGAPEAAPQLAATGSENSVLGIAGIGLAVILAGGVLLLRRSAKSS